MGSTFQQRKFKEELMWVDWQANLTTQRLVAVVLFLLLRLPVSAMTLVELLAVLLVVLYQNAKFHVTLSLAQMVSEEFSVQITLK